MPVFNIILAIILIVLIIIFSLLIKFKIKEDIKTKNLNELLQENNKTLKETNEKLTNEYYQIDTKYKVNQAMLDDLNDNIQEAKDRYKEAQEDASRILENQKKLTSDAFNEWWDRIEEAYNTKEEEYNKNIELLIKTSEAKQAEILQDLDKLKQTRAAAIQASLREKELQANQDDYRLNISEKAVKDIRLLKSIQDDLSVPSVVDKIIWSNYYQPLAKTKFPKIIKKETTCGVYKLTSLKTGLVYIGQSVDICDRWKQHCKNALGVGTTTSENKLYKAMREDGLYNFTFEVIESCPQSQLNEKEKFYIDLYDSYNFGLNSTKGNK